MGTDNRQLDAVLLPSGFLDLEWSPAEAAPGRSASLLQREVRARYEQDARGWLLFLGFADPDVPLSPSLAFWRSFASLFARDLTRTPGLELLRDRVEVPFPAEACGELMGRAPLVPGSEYLSTALLEGLWKGLGRSFREGIRSYKGTVEAFVRELSPRAHLVGRVFFHLVENRKGGEPFAFLATYSTRMGQGGREKHLPLKYALQEYGSDRRKLLDLLATVQAAAGRSELVAGLMDSGELYHPLGWSAAEAYAFLREVPLYEACGILCRIPDWWKGARGGARVSVRVGEAKPSLAGAEALLGFDVSIVLGDESFSPEEARALLEQAEGLALIKNRWVAVDAEKLRATLAALEKARGVMTGGGLTLAEAMKLQLAPEKALGGAGAAGVEVGVSSGAWLASVVEKMRNPLRAPAAPPGKEFRARLRAYQQAGLNWLAFLHGLGFGACLADDMGLGKTVQVLAFLDRRREAGNGGPSLLVLPASLIANWMNEIERFAPKLRAFVAHPGYQADRAVPPMNAKAAGAFDLVITTYALARRYEWLRDVTWDCVILDEAQAIKNPGAAQTRAVKKLPASTRIVMTGTPVENHLGDLWSLFDFLNPGLLGNAGEFKRFARTLGDDASGYGRLRRLVGPYILRRLKTDRSVISDLPDKVEMKSYAGLSRRQALLYQQAVTDLGQALQAAEGIRRKGLVLGALTKFKQLCNHPDQYLGTGEYAEQDAGKFGRLREICETVREKREKALVFTQFREITEPLADFLAGVFRREGVVLHGGVPVKKRRKIVDAFQGDGYVPFMVLSLKAGGVGLNLTAASHVVHFDRWWNPAVENQATDRAFRIGQKKNVIVHKFVTRGTIEERIDAMLEEKGALFDRVVAATGEAWITELDDRELMEMFTLRR